MEDINSHNAVHSLIPVYKLTEVLAPVLITVIRRTVRREEETRLALLHARISKKLSRIARGGSGARTNDRGHLVQLSSWAYDHAYFENMRLHPEIIFTSKYYAPKMGMQLRKRNPNVCRFI